MSDQQPSTGTGLVDHHCHGITLRELDRAAFESMMNEGPRTAGSTPFDSMLGVAMRRWCAPVLGLDPLVPAEEYLARRGDLGAAEASRRLVAAADIGTFLVDTGLDGVCSPAELGALAGGETHEVVRLERVAEDLLAAGAGPGPLAERVEERLAASGAIAAKSVAAYRAGLALPAHKPDPAELAAVLAGVPTSGGRPRLAHPVVHAWLAWTAIEAGLPLQLHVGYGDRDLDLRDSDPLLLTPFLRATEERGVPVLLLHTYPFHRQAGYLAQVFAHVHMDVGLAVHNTGALSPGLLRESLELVPFGKLLFSSDAYGLAEHYLLGAHLFRRGLAGVLAGLVAAGELGEPDAAYVARLVSRDNARRVYGLGATE